MQIRLFNYQINTMMDLFETYSNNIFFRACYQFFTMIKFYLFWIVIHYITTHAYSNYCTPMSMLGFFTSPLLAISPACRAVDWMRTVSIYTIENMWYLFGIWISSHMTGLFRGISQRIQR